MPTETTKDAVPAKRPLSPEQRAEEIAMMEGKGTLWSTYPVCHVKRPMTKGWPEMGAIIVGFGPTIFDYSVWANKNFDENKKIAVYSSFDEMVDDGWIVD